jgi:hypothetical protein
MNSMNPKVDKYLAKAKKWQEEMEKLRRISLDCGLTEELKWGKPCYTFQSSNIVIIQGFKEFCALMFCKGALLKDRKGILKEFGWQAARRVPFTNVREGASNFRTCQRLSPERFVAWSCATARRRMCVAARERSLSFVKKIFQNWGARTCMGPS